MSDNTLTPFPYTFTDVYRVCLRISTLVPAFVLAGHQVVSRLVYTRECRPFMGFEVHNDEHYEINICLAGEAVVTGAKDSLVTPGTVVYQEPHTTTAWRSGEHGCLLVFLWMSIEPFARLPEPQRWPVWPWALYDLALITEESRNNNHGWAERAAWRTATVFSRVVSRSPDLNKPEKPPSYAHEYLPDVVERYLAHHLASPITIDEIAATAQVSRRTLLREYRRRTGLTIMERLRQMRMNGAVFCLLQTSLPLADIAVQIGIPDTNYFCRVFHRHFGMPPLQYRKTMGN